MRFPIHATTNKLNSTPNKFIQLFLPGLFCILKREHIREITHPNPIVNADSSPSEYMVSGLYVLFSMHISEQKVVIIDKTQDMRRIWDIFMSFFLRVQHSIEKTIVNNM